MNVLILNGPNLNLLGTREPSIYGSKTLQDVAAECQAAGAAIGMAIDFRQSNHEGELVEWIQQASGTADAIVINAAAYTHTSVAIHDALKAYDGLKIELHISNPHLRESFRHTSLIAPVADAVVAGLGTDGYCHVLEVLPDLLGKA